MRLKVDIYDSGRTVKRGIITLDDIRKKFNLPKDAEVSIRVPSGGDWSGMDASIGEDIPHLSVKVETIR